MRLARKYDMAAVKAFTKMSEVLAQQETWVIAKKSHACNAHTK
jgi:hypothetical protein